MTLNEPQPIEISSNRKSKYGKYDSILGYQKMTYDKKRGRHQAYEQSSIHSFRQFIDILKARENDLVFNIHATIPYLEFNYSSEPTKENIQELHEIVINKVSEATPLKFVCKRASKGDNNILTSKTYICQQDVASKKGGRKTSRLKQYRCKSKLLISHRQKYSFTMISITHNYHHTTLKLIHMPTGSKAFIEEQDGTGISELFDKIHNDERFVEYLDQPSTTPNNEIRALLAELTEPK